MGWRWATVLLLVYLIVMHSFWWVEQQSVWGRWRTHWEQEWAQERDALHAGLAEIDALLAAQERMAQTLAAHQAGVIPKQRNRKFFWRRSGVRGEHRREGEQEKD